MIQLFKASNENKLVVNEFDQSSLIRTLNYIG